MNSVKPVQYENSEGVCVCVLAEMRQITSFVSSTLESLFVCLLNKQRRVHAAFFNVPVCLLARGFL